MPRRTENATGGLGPPSPEERPGARSRAAVIAARAIWAVGMLLLAAIVAWSAFELRRFTGQALAGLDLRRAAWIAGCILVAAALWGAVLWNRGPFRQHSLATGLVAVLLIRLIDVALVPAPLVSDFLTYNQLGVQISQHGPMLAAVPTGYPMALGVVYALFGAQPAYAQLLNCLIAVATAALVYDTARRLWNGNAARWALWLFALAPAQILMTSVLASEAPYGLLLMLAVWLSVRLGSRRFVAALAIGGVLAASDYVRATSPALIPAFAVLPFLASIRARIATAWAAVLVLSFLFVLVPVVTWNLQSQGVLSISPSDYGGWSLLVGTDPAHTGQYNAALVNVVGGTPGTPEFDRRAGQIAIDRLRAKPLQFLELAAKKFPLMWAIDNYGVFYTMGTASNSDASASLVLLSQAAYLAIVGLALAGLWRVRTSLPPAVMTMILILAALVVVHSFLEVEPRYHAYLVPIFCILAGPAGAALHLPRLRGARSGGSV